MSAGEIRVFVHHRAADSPDPSHTDPSHTDPIYTAYVQAANELAGTPGYLGDELLSPRTDTGRRTLLMRWDGAESYAAWERAHRASGHPSPLRSYQDRKLPGGHYETFVVVAASRDSEQQATTDY